MNTGGIRIMNKIYGLRNDKENISLIIGDDKAMLIIQTAESFKARELNLEIDLENESKISADKVKPINISTNKITGGTIDGNNIVIDSLQPNILAGKIENLETKLKEKDEEISKLKDLVNTKVSSEEFWDFVKYYTEESDALAEVEPIDITEYYKDETQQKEQPEPVQRALKRIKELDYITDVRIDEEFETTVDGFPENRLTITIDYLDVDFVKEARKADKYKELEI